ncbi:MAG TPA: AbrB/MazE/SpoVT family DNA-binding domain-containing protein [Gemmataceae bacterium]|jgi:antitoxin MazE|nr:AbrB/MazE/SpoVT family DNA-binding domain-containing protein [Gemmataceae bacterium]
MKTQIGKWGNSLAVRIPGIYAKELGLKEGMELEISLAQDAITLRPGQHEYSLDELVSGITEENRHAETDWGTPRGREAW